MKFKRRLLSLLLVFVMLLSFVPTAFADEVTGGTGETDPEITTPAEDEATSDGGEDAVPDAVADPTGGAGDADDADGAGDAGSETAGPAENEDNANQIVGEVEPWVYQPSSEPMMAMMALAEDAFTEDAEVSKILVTTEDGTPVPNATVEVKVDGDSEPRITGTTDENGVFTFNASEHMSDTERYSASVSAYKTVARGIIPSGSGRTPLFQGFTNPGQRWEMELHSEWIDEGGNWRGEELPTVGGNAVEIAFVVDTTGSMSGDIKRVCDNIAAFSETLVSRGLNFRASFISFRDMKIDSASEKTTLYADASGNHWFNTMEGGITAALTALSDTSGGGDGPETPFDGLGFAIKNLDWSSGSKKYAFLITDANFHVDNGYGYTNIQDVALALQSSGIITSVITEPGYKELYSDLYTWTEGMYVSLRGDFADDMAALASDVSSSATGDKTLKLVEPRLLVNMTASYLEDSSTSYESNVRTVLNQYANRLAESTDGHVMVKEFLLIPTMSRTNFYDTDNHASMADIRIESTVKESVRIGSNAHVYGFFNDSSVTTNTGRYVTLPTELASSIRGSYLRIQLSGITGSWNHSLASTDSEELRKYSTTIDHESGHYLLGFYDEYMNGLSTNWSKIEKTRSHYYGLMDNHRDNHEISRVADDYPAVGYPTTQAEQTRQFYENGKSCEDQLATFLESGSTPKNGTLLTLTALDGLTYQIKYTKVSGHDRDATYSSEVNPTFTMDASAAMSRAAGDNLTEATTTFADIEWSVSGSNVVMSLTPKAGHNPTSVVYTTLNGRSGSVDVSGNTATVPVDASDLAEVKVVEGSACNVYYVDRYNSNFFYESASGGVVANVTGATGTSTFIADGYTDYTYDGRNAVNEATYIDTNGTGTIYSVIDYSEYIDYSTLAWYKYDGANWSPLTTYVLDHTDEENMNIGMKANINGSGLYVLMAAPATATAPGTVQITTNESSDKTDGDVTLGFTYSGTGTVDYYNVYYSDGSTVVPEGAGVTVRRFVAGGDKYVLNLGKYEKKVTARVEAVLSDGTRTELSTPVTLVGGTAFSYGDRSTPNWFNNKYKLWNKWNKDPGLFDADNDGVSNYDEYVNKTEPKVPSARPTTTTTATTTSFVNIPAFVGGTVIASNRNAAAGDWVNLFVTPAEGYELTSLTVTDQRGWPVTLREISGGYYFIMPAARVNISAVFSPIGGEDAGASTTVPTVPDVSNPSSIGAWVPNQTEKFPVQRTGTMSFSDVNPADWYYESVQYSWQRALMNGTDAGEFSPNASMTRGMVWTVLARMNGRDTDGGSPWYQKGLDYVVYNDISDGTDPNGSITRQQLITMLWRNEGDPYGNNTSLAGFADGDTVADWADGAVRWAVSVGLLQGDETGALNPAATATRAEVATILMRYCQNVA